MSLLSDIGALSNPFGAPSQGEWNLSPGVFTTKTTNKKVTFFFEKKDPDPTQKTAIADVTDTGGRRIVKYRYPYRDGQRLSDLGREGETFSFNIKFFGDNYQQKFQEFLTVVNTNDSGILTHPIRSAQDKGGIPCRFRNYEFLHRHDEFNAVTIKAVFEEDNTDELASANLPVSSNDSILRSALQLLTSTQSFLSANILAVTALLLLPAAIKAAMIQRLNSIMSQYSDLLGQLAATFSSDAHIQNLVAQSSTNTAGSGVSGLTAGTVALPTSGASQTAQLPPVFQVGFDPITQAAINSGIQAFVSANQITPQQAVFSANQLRQAITAAILEVETNLGNDGYDIMVTYRNLAVSIQSSVEAAIAAAQSLVTIYSVPSDMSLRTVAFNNGLTADDQNAIEALNPYLPSVNLIPEGTMITVPVP